MKKLEIIIRHSRLTPVRETLVGLGIHGMTVTEVKGFGRQGGHKEIYRGNEVSVEFIPKLKLEIVARAEQVDEIMQAVQKAACTGNVGDGKIFVTPVERVMRIRTQEQDHEAV